MDRNTIERIRRDRLLEAGELALRARRQIDDAAVDAARTLSRTEGIIPALEPAHALAAVIELAPKKSKDHIMVMNMCGRGDKDIFTVADHLGGM